MIAVPIGQALVQAGLITGEQVDAALEEQKREGGRIGQHLILAGAVTRREMYAALADQWESPLVDLVADPVDASLVVGQGKAYYDRGWVPWRKVREGLIIATSVPPNEALMEEARRITGYEQISVRTTTDWDIVQAVSQACRDDLVYAASDLLADQKPHESARAGLTRWQMYTPPIVTGVFVAFVIIAPRISLIVALAVTNAAFLISIAFKSVAALRWPIMRRRALGKQLAILKERERRGLPIVPDGRIPDDELPIYTILVPAYNESNIIEKLINNLGSLDYPKSKLDVLVLLEQDDVETVSVAKAMRPPEYVRIMVVPEGNPQTKPRACNYGLSFARGEYVVIYDAEDRPDPGQLRMAVAAFRTDEFERRQLHPDSRPVVCVQAALSYFNADFNVLTRMFAVEYALWFGSMLPGLDNSGIPLPLGGTSNHFVTEALRRLGAWDPYNVTEDADLGIRASVEGYKVSVIDSNTWEEAASQTGVWIKQRTRWIKGYMITAAVNTRNPIRFAKRTGPMGVVGLVGLIMATPLAFLAYPLAAAFTVATYIGVRFLGLDLPGWLLLQGVAAMVIGNLTMITVSAIAASRRYSWRIGVFALLTPVYWFLHSYAAWRAAFQMVTSPHGWEKTPHGLTEEYESNIAS